MAGDARLLALGHELVASIKEWLATAQRNVEQRQQRQAATQKPDAGHPISGSNTDAGSHKTAAGKSAGPGPVVLPNPEPQHNKSRFARLGDRNYSRVGDVWICNYNDEQFRALTALHRIY